MQHFMTFTADSMGALRKAITDGHHQRAASTHERVASTRTLLTEARRSRLAAEGLRRNRAAHDTNSRATFVSTLRMQVATIRESVRVWRKEVVGELRAARNAFRSGTVLEKPRRDGPREAHKPEPTRDPFRSGRTEQAGSHAVNERRHDVAATNHHVGPPHVGQPHVVGSTVETQPGDDRTQEARDSESSGHSRDQRRPPKR